MSLLVLGLSHHHAPLDVLERVAFDTSAASELEAAALRGEHVREALVLSTCNRTEVYAEAVTFHGALAELTDAFAEHTGVDRALLHPYLYVHYEERGVAHAFSVSSGLDSMAIGEAQVLGQLRSALRRGQARHHVGPQLNTVLQRALRVGKRVHSETGIDAVSRSLVDAALAEAATEVDLTTASVLMLGAGGMGALAATAAKAAGVRELLIANRGSVRSHTLAERLGGEVVAWEDRQAALGRADVVISSTGARGLVVSTADLVQAQRGRESRALVVVDLALPRDVEPGAATVPGVRLLDLAHLGTLLGDAGHHPQVQAATDLVTAEVAEYLTMRSAETVAPTVSALRRRAEDVVAAELTRLERRLPDLDPAERDEVAKAVHRVVEKLLHAPTVRVKEFAEQGRGGSYARALHELFDLDPRDVSLVSAPVPLVLDPEEGP